MNVTGMPVKSIFLSNSWRGSDEAFPVKFVQVNTAILQFIQIF